ncbi:MAG: hypothetical protein VKL39_23995 [Leptolyngbyaceae bacterium]|nr:hypothetical protein [Leptolyngbyaceae bacterium]
MEIKLKELISLFLETKIEKEEESSWLKNGISKGDYVIVRTRIAGVNAGYLEHLEKGKVVLSNARKLWRFHVAKDKKTGNALDAAVFGILQCESKITGVVETVVMLEDAEIFKTTKEAQKTIEDAPVYETK